MKRFGILFILFFMIPAMAFGSAVTCSEIDYHYYNSDCCESTTNPVQCLETLPQSKVPEIKSGLADATDLCAKIGDIHITTAGEVYICTVAGEAPTVVAS